MMPSLEQLQLSDAIWALRRIVRKKAGFVHIPPAPAGAIPNETCDCPQCIAGDALDRIKKHEEHYARQGVKR